MKIGEIMPVDRDIILNKGKKTVAVQWQTKATDQVR